MNRISKTLQWGFSVFFWLAAFVYGFSWASLFFLLSALLLAPVETIRNRLRKIKVGSFQIVALVVILFIVGVALAPEQQTEGVSNLQARPEAKNEITNDAVKESERTKEKAPIKETFEIKEQEKQAETEKKNEEILQKEEEEELPENEKSSDAINLPSQSEAYSDIPPYSGELFIIVNDNIPSFSASELTTVAYEKYSALDSLGRCGIAIASCGKEIMPAEGEKRGSISHIYPSGWVQSKYDGISGGYLYNRCHLIGWQLSAENANQKNLITGTRSMNVDGMLLFENMIADYIKETENHVAYRVSPLFEGDNLVATGVRMEAYSIEDQGDGICFHVFVYNVQAGITIDYASGNSSKNSVPPVTTVPATTTSPVTTRPPVTTTPPVTTVPPVTTQVIQTSIYILNTNTKKIHRSTCRYVDSIKDSNRQSYSGDLSSLHVQGYENCKVCF